jgi:hypothetical protein
MRKSQVPVKVWLQGDFRIAAPGPRHKDVNATWTGVLPTSQPYSAAPFSYAGTESVPGSMFTVSAAATDIVDWVLIELHDATNPATIIAKRAGFVLENGSVIDINGSKDKDIGFTSVAANNYFVVIRHRNHLAVRTAATVAMSDGKLGGAKPGLVDFSALATAYDNGTSGNPVNKPMALLNGTAPTGTYGMWGGNANGTLNDPNAYAQVRASGPNTATNRSNDYLYLVNTILLGNVGTTIGPIYSSADVNMDGFIKANGPNSDTNRQNDYLFLVNTVLGGSVAKIIAQHQ